MGSCHALVDFQRCLGTPHLCCRPALQPSANASCTIIPTNIRFTNLGAFKLPHVSKGKRRPQHSWGNSRPVLFNGRSSILHMAAQIAASVEEAAPVPTPYINVDQHQSEDATIVEIKFGDRLGALLDTVKALRSLDINVVRAKVTSVDSIGWNRFEVTNKDGGKVTEPELVEGIRLTVIENLLQYHPESSAKLAMGLPAAAAYALPTSVKVLPVDSASSCIRIETPDRPGLLMEIANVLTDISVQILSADIHTEGLVAKDEFLVSYRNEALNKSMQELVTNALQFYLTRYEAEEDSY